MDPSGLFWANAWTFQPRRWPGGKTAGVEAWIAGQPIAVTEVSRFGFVIVQRA